MDPCKAAVPADDAERQQWYSLCGELNEFYDGLHALLEEGSLSKAAARYTIYKENLFRRWVRRELPRDSLDWALGGLFSRFGHHFGLKDRYDSPR
jgi:hypothetical protein